MLSAAVFFVLLGVANTQYSMPLSRTISTEEMSSLPAGHWKQSGGFSNLLDQLTNINVAL